MEKQTRLYVSGVVAAAILGVAAVVLLAPPVRPGMVQPIVLLGALALMAELLGYLLSTAVAGSIAVIPYLGCVLITGNWLAPVAVAAVKIISESQRGNARIKATFNVASHVLGASIAVLVFRALGGVDLLALSNVSLRDATLTIGIPALVAILTSTAVNGFLVSAVIAVSAKRTLPDVWSNSFRSPLGFDLLMGPIIFVFAWMYVAHGPLAALTLWVPILGVRQVHKTNMDLERTNAELLELMVKSIEARDPYTSGHSRRVHHFATIIARAMGLKERDINTVSQAALLHDVGKIHEKYGPILQKADKLTPEEWQIMQQHPADGAELVATMSGLKNIVASIRHHHERWDGTGYPLGLAGEQIPLPARIIMFADTIDAMTSERPYRPGLPSEVVRGELVKCRGKQFDPHISDHVIAETTWRQLFGEEGRAATLRLTVITPDRRVASKM